MHFNLNFPWFIFNLRHFTISPSTRFPHILPVFLQFCKLCSHCKPPVASSWFPSGNLDVETWWRVVQSSWLCITTIVRFIYNSRESMITTVVHALWYYSLIEALSILRFVLREMNEQAKKPWLVKLTSYVFVNFSNLSHHHCTVSVRRHGWQHLHQPCAYSRCSPQGDSHAQTVSSG